MSTATVASAPVRVDRSKIRRPGILRLTGVEMRKMTDTRSGFWLLITIALLSVGFVIIAMFAGSENDKTFYTYFQGTLFPVSLFLPVLGILMVTSEFSQRTTLTTFALVPHRGKVVLAKFLAAIVYSVLSIVTSLIVAALGEALTVALGQTDSADWTIKGTAIAGAALFQVIGVVSGVAFGLLLMNSPAAIVLYFVLPTALMILSESIKAIHGAATWFDLNSASMGLTDNTMTSDAWKHLGTSLLLWFVLPLVLGSVRLARRELK